MLLDVIAIFINYHKSKPSSPSFLASAPIAGQSFFELLVEIPVSSVLVSFLTYSTRTTVVGIMLATAYNVEVRLSFRV